MKIFASGTKPRFDGGGSLFGELHRELPSGTCMMDIDRMFVTVESELWLKRENVAFVEYRHAKECIKFTAVFETKHKYTETAFDLEISANRARMEMARKLDCRLFVVFYSDGAVPLEFYEIDVETGEYEHSYSLTYDQTNRAEKVVECWKALDLTSNAP